MMCIVLLAGHIGATPTSQAFPITIEHFYAIFLSAEDIGLTESLFRGLKDMILFHRTWATGAMPMGAPGCPEFAAKVAST